MASIFNNTANSFANDNDFKIPSEFERISYEFSKYHQTPLNILLHFFTSPLGLVGVFALLKKGFRSSSPGITIILFYLLSLIPEVPNGVFFGSLGLFCIIIQLVRKFELGILASLSFIVLSYVLQDLAHMITGEPTFQSTYSAGGQVIFYFYTQVALSQFFSFLEKLKSFILTFYVML